MVPARAPNERTLNIVDCSVLGRILVVLAVTMPSAASAHFFSPITENDRISPGVSEVAAAWAEDAFYLFGGRYDDDRPSDRILRYAAPHPDGDPVQDPVRYADDSGSHLIRGLGLDGYYDLTQLGNLPEPRRSAAAAFDDATRSVYIFGGIGESDEAQTEMAQTEILRFSVDTLELSPTGIRLPEESYPFAPSATKALGAIHVQAGDRIYRFDPASDSLLEISRLPRVLQGAMMASDGHHLYVAGGYESSLAPNSTYIDSSKLRGEIYAVALAPSLGAPLHEFRQALPSPRAFGAAFERDGFIYVLGGQTDSYAVTHEVVRIEVPRNRGETVFQAAFNGHYEVHVKVMDHRSLDFEASNFGFAVGRDRAYFFGGSNTDLRERIWEWPLPRHPPTVTGAAILSTTVLAIEQSHFGILPGGVDGSSYGSGSYAYVYGDRCDDLWACQAHTLRAWFSVGPLPVTWTEPLPFPTTVYRVAIVNYDGVESAPSLPVILDCGVNCWV